MCGGLQTTDYRLQTTDYRLQTTDYRLQTKDYRLQTTYPTTDYRIVGVQNKIGANSLLSPSDLTLLKKKWFETGLFYKPSPPPPCAPATDYRPQTTDHKPQVTD